MIPDTSFPKIPTRMWPRGHKVLDATSCNLASRDVAQSLVTVGQSRTFHLGQWTARYCTSILGVSLTSLLQGVGSPYYRYGAYPCYRQGPCSCYRQGPYPCYRQGPCSCYRQGPYPCYRQGSCPCYRQRPYDNIVVGPLLQVTVGSSGGGGGGGLTHVTLTPPQQTSSL